MKLDKLPGPIQPLTFQLVDNYRSHAGIVNCAHTIIKLITQLWPDTIDEFQHEQGIANGVKPIFYTDIDSDFIKEVRSSFQLAKFRSYSISQGRFLSRNTK